MRHEDVKFGTRVGVRLSKRMLRFLISLLRCAEWRQGVSGQRRKWHGDVLREHLYQREVRNGHELVLGGAP